MSLAEVFKNRILAGDQTLDSVPKWLYDEVKALLDEEGGDE